MMSMAEFEAEKARLLTQYGSTSREAGQRRAQELARLYARSKWTVRAIAEIQQQSYKTIDFQVRFGRFLLLCTNCTQTGLTEGRFRQLWLQTDKTATEDARFAAVAALLAEAQAAPRSDARQLGKSIVAHFADGKWHRVQEIAEQLQTDVQTVMPLLDRMVAQGLYKTHTERRPSAHEMASYRIVKGGNKTINLTAFYAETKPILDEMQQLISGHHVHFSQEVMGVLFTRFRQKIDQLAH